jgi:3-oxoacyl-[acyl-carrier-protein] synthase-1
MSPQVAETPIIESVGAMCAVGRGTSQVYASVRTGIGRIAASSVYDRHFEPIHMALLPEDALEPLADELEPLPLTSRRRRMVRLAAPALREAMADVAEDVPPMPLFIGLPEPRPGAPPVEQAHLTGALTAQTGIVFDEDGSVVFPRGRASVLFALEAGVQCLREGRAESVLVGGIDTYLDLALLGELDLEGRIHGPRVVHGFVPGEGAAFLRLTFARASRRAPPHPRVTILGVGTAQDPGHRYSDQPALGEGLSHAMEMMFATLPRSTALIENTFAGFNGEMFGAKEWGVASLRHHERFSPAAKIEHPADCFGDTGAATGALLVVLAHTSLTRGDRTGPALIFSASDGEDRACALIDLLA